MTRSGVVLLIPDPSSDGSCAWRLGSMTPDGVVVEKVQMDSGLNLEGAITALAEYMCKLDYRGGPAVLGLPSSMCLFARMPLGGDAVHSKTRKRSREAWRYKLEERLPVAAEQVVADYLWQHDAVMGVAVFEEVLRSLVDALTSAGIRLRAIVPLNVLALASRTPGWRKQRVDIVVWSGGEGLEYVRLNEQHESVAWVLRDQESDGNGHLPVSITADFDEPIRAAGIGVNADQFTSHRAIDWVDIQDSTLEADAVHYSEKILKGEVRPPVDLLANGLSPSWVPQEIRRPLTGVVTAVLLLLMTWIGTMYWQTMRYESQLSTYRTAEAQLYRDAFPGKSVPANVRSRLVSEHRKLQVLGNASVDDQPEQSALKTLYESLASMPTEIPLRIEKLTVGGSAAQIEGLTLSHGDAESLAAALRETNGWRVETPHTEQRRDGTVGFSITATVTPVDRVAANPVRITSGAGGGGL